MATVLTNVGKADIVSRMRGGGTEALYVAWGTGAGTAAVADTTLFTESAEARVLGTSSQQTTTVTNDTHRLTGTITASAGRTITNAGSLTASTAGNLWVHGDHASTTLLTGESIAYTIDIKIA